MLYLSLSVFVRKYWCSDFLLAWWLVWSVSVHVVYFKVHQSRNFHYQDDCPVPPLSASLI